MCFHQYFIVYSRYFNFGYEFKFLMYLIHWISCFFLHSLCIWSVIVLFMWVWIRACNGYGSYQSRGKYWRIIIICLTEQTCHVVRSRWVWWRTWVLIITCWTWTKQTRHVNRSIWVWWRTWVLCRPCMWVPDIVIIFSCVTNITSNIYRNNAT